MCVLKIIFKKAHRAFHINSSNCCLSVCVWILTIVAKIITSAHRDLSSCTHRPTNEPDCTLKTRPAWPTLLVKITRANRHFQASSTSQPWDACFMYLLLLFQNIILIPNCIFTPSFNFGCFVVSEQIVWRKTQCQPCSQSISHTYPNGSFWCSENPNYHRKIKHILQQIVLNTAKKYIKEVLTKSL